MNQILHKTCLKNIESKQNIAQENYYARCGAQVIYRPGPFTRGESKGPSRGGL